MVKRQLINKMIAFCSISRLGNKENNVSVNLIKALELAKSVGSAIIGIGRDGGLPLK